MQQLPKSKASTEPAPLS